MKNVEEEALVKVGPGTPSGELFRRYWLPVEAAANLDRRNPIRLKALGEELVLFRDSSGKPGLLGEHCAHRGTSLHYGRVEGDCLRCIFHGWLFDKEGKVVEMPGEPPASTFKDKVKHPAYPCMEVGGLIFAYMGPPDKKPSFPKYSQLFREDGVRVTGNGGYVEQCNVFQALHDNNLDPWHGEIAHSWFSPDKRDSFLHHGRDGEPPSPLKFERTPWGTRYVDLKSTTTPGEYEYHETYTVWPTQRCNRPDGSSMKWAAPVDDYRTRWFTVDFFPFVDGEPSKEAIRAQNNRFHIGYVENLPKDWAEQVGSWSNFDHPWRGGNLWEDEVAQATQGSPGRNYLPDWENWHLGSADEGTILNRKVWREQVKRIRQGLDPIGVIRSSKDDKLIFIPSENKLVSWDEGMRLFNMTVEQRLEMLTAENGKRSLRAAG